MTFHRWAAQASSPASRTLINAAFAATVACCPAVALASDSSPANTGGAATDIIVVSAMRAPSLLSEVGSSVTAISADDIRAGQFVFAADAIAQTPGVSLARNGGAGGAASIRLRGASSGQTLVIIDGVAVNDPAAPQGGYNFGALDAADIERIEVLRGPQSLLYGADAIGGVIAVTTRRSGSSLDAFIEGGSHATMRGGASALIGGGADFARLTLSGFKTGGVSRASIGTEADGFRSLSASFSGGATLSDVWRAEITARGNDAHAQIDGFPPPDFNFADTDETENSRELSLAGRALHDAGGLSGALTLGFSKVSRRNFDGPIETFSARGNRLSADYLAVYAANSHLRLFAGAEAERTHAIVSGIDKTANAGAIFVMGEVKPVAALTLSAGVRRDEFSGVGGATTARFAAALKASDATILRASFGEGFRAPSLFERYYDQFGVTPNPNLRPEHARGGDIGVEQRFGAAGRHRFTATLFHLHVRDQIDFDFGGNGYLNIDETRSRGVETELALALSETVSVAAGYTLTDTIDKTTGARLLRVPRHRGVLTVSFTPADKLSVSASLTLNGREADVPAANDAFARLDLRASYAISDRIELYGRAENASDAGYEDVSGYGEPGVALYGGVRVRL